MWFKMFLLLRDEQFTIVIQQPVQALQYLRFSQI